MRRPNRAVLLVCWLAAIGLAIPFGHAWDEVSAATAIIGYGAQEQDLSTSDSAVRGYQVISHTRDESIVNPLRKWDTVVEVNGDSRERFIMHRVYMPSNHKRGAIILLPALAFRFETYMFDESGDPMNSLAAELALAGYDVYGYSFRNTFVPPRGCSTGAFDCSVMAHWGWAESWLPDIEYIRQNVKGNVKPAIGGISRGGALAIAAINQNPNAYSGLLDWDVMLYSENPRIIGINTFACNSLTAAVNNGVYANEAIGNLKIIVPLNIFAAMNVFSTPGPQFTGNFIQLVANATRTGFQFADYERVKALVATTTDVEPIAGTRDGVCSMKGDRTFTGNLASFSGPILAFEEEFGFGPYMQDTINLTSSTNVRVVFNPGGGHLDSWMSPDHVAKIDSVIIDWLDNDVFPEQRLRR